MPGPSPFGSRGKHFDSLELLTCHPQVLLPSPSSFGLWFYLGSGSGIHPPSLLPLGPSPTPGLAMVLALGGVHCLGHRVALSYAVISSPPNELKGIQAAMHKGVRAVFLKMGSYPKETIVSWEGERR